jgi:hypothetical protein
MSSLVSLSIRSFFYSFTNGSVDIFMQLCFMQRVMRMECRGTTMFEHYNVHRIVTCPFTPCSQCGTYVNSPSF